MRNVRITLSWIVSEDLFTEQALIDLADGHSTLAMEDFWESFGWEQLGQLDIEDESFELLETEDESGE